MIKGSDEWVSKLEKNIACPEVNTGTPCRINNRLRGSCGVCNCDELRKACDELRYRNEIQNIGSTKDRFKYGFVVARLQALAGADKSDVIEIEKEAVNAFHHST